jgi:hypothetical protein
MAQACGDAPIPGPAFIPGVDFDPFDPEDREIIADVMARHRMEEDRRVERENGYLRAENARLRRQLGLEDEEGGDGGMTAAELADWDRD